MWDTSSPTGANLEQIQSCLGPIDSYIGEKKPSLINPNSPELLESLKLTGVGGANGPPLLNY